jgi:hypothetical protein
MRKTHAADLVASLAVLTVAIIGEVRMMFARTAASRLGVASSTSRLIERCKINK